MSVLNFRPHYLAILVAEDGVIDANGDYQPGEHGTAYEGRIPCCAVPAGKAATITLPDGRSSEYSFTLYLDKGAPALKFGDRVRIYDRETDMLIAEKNVLGFFSYQISSRAWV